MPKPYYVLVGYLSGMSLMLMIVAVILAITVSQRAGQVNKLPNFEHYEIGSKYDTSQCANYTEVEYGSSWYANGPLGYCTLTDYLPKGMTQVSLMLRGSFIDSVTFRVSPDVKVIDLINAWGLPVKINKWTTTTQYNWIGRKVYASHNGGGRPDNQTIYYIYFWKGGA